MLGKLWAQARNLLTHPTVEVAFVQSVLSYAISQGLFDLSVVQTGVVMAVVTAATGLVAALLTQQALLVWLISLGQGVGSLIVAFDLADRFHWDTKTAASVIAMLVFVLGLVQHSKAVPKYGPLAESRARENQRVNHMMGLHEQALVAGKDPVTHEDVGEQIQEADTVKASCPGPL